MAKIDVMGRYWEIVEEQKKSPVVRLPCKLDVGDLVLDVDEEIVRQAEENRRYTEATKDVSVGEYCLVS